MTGPVRVVARAVVIRDDAILLVQEVGQVYRFFPGGRVEPGETPTDALVRELREELDVAATITAVLGAVDNRFVEDGVEHRAVEHAFAVRIDADDPVSHEAHLVAGWLPLDELATADVRPRVLVDLVLDYARRR